MPKLNLSNFICFLKYKGSPDSEYGNFLKIDMAESAPDIEIL